uniref:Flap endonuclease 1 n=1 Tax=Panagrolaimus sp. PS1159 TaxID=55785 RepID=A0AC35FQE8_9BILA
MGIKDLSKVIADHSPDSIKTNDIKAYFSRKIAIDASMSLYQFLIAIRQDGMHLQDESGETTSHLNGMFYRTIRIMENGIKPVFVFDGKPPTLKAGELEKRSERRAETEKQLTEAVEKGDVEAINKFNRRLVKVTKQQNDEAKRLLKLMGVPIIEAPCEAEAQCAELVKAGKVFATATEDMDALTFGSKVLVRHLTFSEAKKMPIKEFNLDKILRDLDFTMEQFIDMCIMLGCDYCPSIKGVGLKKAFELINTHKSIEAILENLDTDKYPPPEDWQFAAARELFLHPEVTKGDETDLKWTDPDEEGVMEFLCKEKGFNEERVKTALQRLHKGRKTATQGRIDMFFQSSGHKATEPSATKRKAAEDKTTAAKKAKTAAAKPKKGAPKRGK